MKIQLTVLLLTLSFYTTAQTGSIEGKVYYKGELEPIYGVTVWLPGTMIGDVSDFDGNFKIDSVKAGTFHLLIGNAGSVDTLKAVTVRPNTVTYLEIGIDQEVCPDRQAKNCPIDGNTKEVIRVVDGMGNLRQNRRARRGKIFLTGCLWIGCMPTWHCKRHDHQY